MNFVWGLWNKVSQEWSPIRKIIHMSQEWSPVTKIIHMSQEWSPVTKIILMSQEQNVSQKKRLYLTE